MDVKRPRVVSTKLEPSTLPARAYKVRPYKATGVAVYGYFRQRPAKSSRRYASWKKLKNES